MFLRVNSLLEATLGILATMAIAWFVKIRLDGKTITFEKALSKALSRWLPAIGTNIVMGIFLVGLFLLFIAPGVIFIVYWSFAMMVVLFEDKSFLHALKFSKAVVEGRWWRTLGILLAFSILSAVFGGFAAIPSYAMTFLLGDVISQPFIVITDTIIDLAVAYFTIASTIFYLNMRETRKSGQKKK
jgi:hypothetical protein